LTFLFFLLGALLGLETQAVAPPKTDQASVPPQSSRDAPLDRLDSELDPVALGEDQGSTSDKGPDTFQVSLDALLDLFDFLDFLDSA